MVKKISPEILRMKIGVSRREPHIRWNWERAEGLGMDGQGHRGCLEILYGLYIQGFE